MTAQDLGPEGPDFQFGFGHMQTDVAVEFVHRLNDGCPSAGIHVGQLAPGDSDTLHVSVISGDRPFKACLTWMDPATGSNNHSVLNDLDLRLENDAWQRGVALGDARSPNLSWTTSLTSVSRKSSPPCAKPTTQTMWSFSKSMPCLATFTASLFSTTDCPWAPQSYALTWQEVIPEPWSLPTTSAESLTCSLETEALQVFAEDGTLLADACGNSLSHGAYFVQRLDEDGCHQMRTFEVDCGHCPGDLDGNGVVGSSDLMALLALNGNPVAYCNASCTASNLTGSLGVDIDDLLLFLSVFGNACNYPNDQTRRFLPARPKRRRSFRQGLEGNNGTRRHHPLVEFQHDESGAFHPFEVRLEQRMLSSLDVEFDHINGLPAHGRLNASDGEGLHVRHRVV